MKAVILITGLLLSVSAFSTVYESTQHGVPTFSNIKTPHAKKINVPSVTTMIRYHFTPQEQQENKQYVQQQQKQSAEDYNSTTLQGSFPAQDTDHYYDFDGRNHQYMNLMSSTGTSVYSENYNDARLTGNYGALH
jgi:hypothetical protein